MARRAAEDIVLADGTYSNDYTISTSCAASSPLRIVGEGTAGWGANASGDWTIDGARVIVTGIDFVGGRARIEGTNNKIVANRFSGWTGNAIAFNDVNGTEGEVAYNEIYSPAAFTPTSCPDETTEFRMGLRMTTSSNLSASVHTDLWIHHNYFHDFPDKPCDNFSSGQSDAIELGEANYSGTATFDSGRVH